MRKQCSKVVFYNSWLATLLRVKLRRVTAASYLPEFKIGSQQNINNLEGAEVAGEALEMATLRRGNESIQNYFRLFLILLQI